jgi:hypothetical protein
MAVAIVATTHPALVTCSFFVYRANTTLVKPSAELIFAPVVDPYVEPALRPDYVRTDKAGSFFLTRSEAVATPSADSPVSIPIFVSNQQSSGKRQLHIYCAAKCAANLSATAVSAAIPVLLQSRTSYRRRRSQPGCLLPGFVVSCVVVSCSALPPGSNWRHAHSVRLLAHRARTVHHAIGEVHFS